MANDAESVRKGNGVSNKVEQMPIIYGSVYALW